MRNTSASAPINSTQTGSDGFRRQPGTLTLARLCKTRLPFRINKNKNETENRTKIPAPHPCPFSSLPFSFLFPSLSLPSSTSTSASADRFSALSVSDVSPKMAPQKQGSLLVAQHDDDVPRPAKAEEGHTGQMRRSAGDLGPLDLAASLLLFSFPFLAFLQKTFSELIDRVRTSLLPICG